MKKIILITLVFIPFFVSAQRFNGGILLGLTASQVDGDSYAGYDKVGLQGGVFVNTSFSDYFGAQMEIKYTGRGARKKTTEYDPSIYKVTLNYIDIPVMLTLTVKKKFIGEAGLVPGYLFGLSGENSTGTGYSDVTVGYRKFDLDWLLGFRYRFNDQVAVGFRYSYSLFSIRKNEYSTSTSYSFIGNMFGYLTGDYNNYLTFGVYYQF